MTDPERAHHMPLHTETEQDPLARHARRPRRPGGRGVLIDKTSGTAKTSTTRNPALRFFTIKYTAQCIGVSTKTVGRHIKSGALPAHKIGKLVRISEADLAGFLALRRDAE
jgi:excisionase family DNA binding protein